MIDWILQIVLEAELIFLFIMFFSERSNPYKVLLWTVIFIFMPLVGFVIYIFIGQTFYSTDRFRKKGLKDEKIKEFVSSDVKNAEAESDLEYKRIGQAMLRMGAVGYSGNNDVKL